MAAQAAALENKQIARVYGDALWALAAQHGQTESVLEELDHLVTEVLEPQPQIQAFLDRRGVNRDQKARVIESAFRGRVSDLLCNFMHPLNKHGRLGALTAVRIRMHELFNKSRNIEPVTVVSAVPLDAASAQQLGDVLASRFQIQPFLQPTVDPSILGGLIVRIGDRVYDYSVRSQLRKLRDGILTRSSYEIRSR